MIDSQLEGGLSPRPQPKRATRLARARRRRELCDKLHSLARNLYLRNTLMAQQAADELRAVGVDVRIDWAKFEAAVAGD